MQFYSPLIGGFAAAAPPTQGDAAGAQPQQPGPCPLDQNPGTHAAGISALLGLTAQPGAAYHAAGAHPQAAGYLPSGGVLPPPFYPPTALPGSFPLSDPRLLFQPAAMAPQSQQFYAQQPQPGAPAPGSAAHAAAQQAAVQAQIASTLSARLQGSVEGVPQADRRSAPLSPEDLDEEAAAFAAEYPLLREAQKAPAGAQARGLATRDELRSLGRTVVSDDQRLAPASSVRNPGLCISGMVDSYSRATATDKPIGRSIKDRNLTTANLRKEGRELALDTRSDIRINAGVDYSSLIKMPPSLDSQCGVARAPTVVWADNEDDEGALASAYIWAVSVAQKLNLPSKCYDDLAALCFCGLISKNSRADIDDWLTFVEKQSLEALPLPSIENRKTAGHLRIRGDLLVLISLAKSSSGPRPQSLKTAARNAANTGHTTPPEMARESCVFFIRSVLPTIDFRELFSTILHKGTQGNSWNRNLCLWATHLSGLSHIAIVGFALTSNIDLWYRDSEAQWRILGERTRIGEDAAYLLHQHNDEDEGAKDSVAAAKFASLATLGVYSMVYVGGQASLSRIGGKHISPATVGCTHHELVKVMQDYKAKHQIDTASVPLDISDVVDYTDHLDFIQAVARTQKCLSEGYTNNALNSQTPEEVARFEKIRAELSAMAIDYISSKGIGEVMDSIPIS